MTLLSYVLYNISVILLSILLAHMIGFLYSRKYKASPKNILSFMTGLPTIEYQDGLVKNYNKIIYTLRKKVIYEIKQNPKDVEAYSLASKLGENPSLIECVLDEIARKIPHKVKVSSKGKLFYDFEVDQISILTATGLLEKIKRIFLSFIVFIANIGAVWPFILIVTIGAVIITNVFSIVSKDGFGMATLFLILGALILGLVLLIVILVAKLFQFLLNPLIKSPVIAKKNYDYFNTIQEETQVSTPKITPKKKTTSSQEKKEDTSILGEIFGSIGELGGVGIFLVVFVAFVIAVGWIFISIVMWFVNLFKAIWKEKTIHPDISPEEWVHTKMPESGITEKLFAGNDLVIKFLRAIKNIFSKQRPSDRFMAERILDLAVKNNGSLSSTEIALAEEIGLKEATDIGAKLISKVGGDIVVSDNGDMVFVFKDSALDSIKKSTIQPADYKEETVKIKPDGTIQSNPKGILINVPGVTNSYYNSLFRLISGACLLSSVGFLLVSSYSDSYMKLSEKIFIYAIPLIPFGVFVLSGILNYSLKISLYNGVLRDIVRSTIRKIKSILLSQQMHFDAEEHAKNIFSSIKIIFPKITYQEVLDTVEKTCLELGLDIDMEGITSNTDKSKVVYNLKKIYQSQDAVNKLRQSGEIGKTFDKEKEEIIFQS